MALSPILNGCRIDYDAGKGSIRCFYETSSDLPTEGTSANTLFASEFALIPTSTWITGNYTTINPNLIIPEVTIELIKIADKSTENYSTYILAPKSYMKEATISGGSDTKKVAFKTYTGILAGWTEEDDWTNDPEVDSAETGEEPLFTLKQWDLEVISSTDYAPIWLNNVVTSFPSGVTPPSGDKLCKFAVSEEAISQSGNVKYRTNATFWIAPSGYTWET